MLAVDMNERSNRCTSDAKYQAAHSLIVAHIVFYHNLDFRPLFDAARDAAPVLTPILLSPVNQVIVFTATEYQWIRVPPCGFMWPRENPVLAGYRCWNVCKSRRAHPRGNWIKCSHLCHVRLIVPLRSKLSFHFGVKFPRSRESGSIHVRLYQFIENSVTGTENSNRVNFNYSIIENDSRGKLSNPEIQKVMELCVQVE